jgi:6-phosphogluconolactonase
MRGEDPDPDRAAADYERLLRSTFQRESRALPRFDLVLLGMGADGHTVSLFPGSPALRESARLVVAPYVARLQTYRLTLTLPVLNEARSIFFLVSGEEKARMLKTVLGAVGRGHEIPSQMIFPSHGTITWFVDSAAARLLARREASLP